MNALARAFSSQPVSYKKAPNDLGVFYGDPGAIRTHDLLLRRQLLYPTELRDRMRGFISQKLFYVNENNV